MNGIINVYKEKGYTSHDVVAVLRKILKQKKIGHTGTLDPEAEGVLPVCIGKATKLASIITDGTKEYIANIQFGKTTTTGDHTGKVVEIFKYNFDILQVEKVIYSFIGEYMQTPPMYSAVKVNGRRLYELAREGKIIKREPRKVIIHDIEILEIYKPDKVKIRVVCSKGTYIRTLCEDIGMKLKYGAHMNGLIRTKSGEFDISKSFSLEHIRNFSNSNELNKVVLKIEDVLIDYPKIIVKKDKDKFLLNGNIIELHDVSTNIGQIVKNKIVRIYMSTNTFVGLYIGVEINGKISLKPYKILIDID